MTKQQKRIKELEERVDDLERRVRNQECRPDWVPVYPTWPPLYPSPWWTRPYWQIGNPTCGNTWGRANLDSQTFTGPDGHQASYTYTVGDSGTPLKSFTFDG